MNRVYTVEFFAEVKHVLSKDGVLSFSLGHYENHVSKELARLLASTHQTLRQTFANVLVIPGGRVFFLASDGALHQDIAARLEQRHIATRLITGHYLNAMLSPDRMADIHDAISQAAELNKDFSPVLYYYHLRHWMSQLSGSIGLWRCGVRRSSAGVADGSQPNERRAVLAPWGQTGDSAPNTGVCRVGWNAIPPGQPSRIQRVVG